MRDSTARNSSVPPSSPLPLPLSRRSNADSQFGSVFAAFFSLRDGKDGRPPWFDQQRREGTREKGCLRREKESALTPSRCCLRAHIRRRHVVSPAPDPFAFDQPATSPSVSHPPDRIAMSTPKPQASKLKDSSSSMDADEKDEGVASPNEVAQERANDAATGLSGEGAAAAEGDEQAPLARFGFDSQQHTSRQRAACTAQGTGGVQRKEWRNEGNAPTRTAR